MNSYAAVLFFSTNYAIWTARVLKKNNIQGKMIPIPRHLSSDCGYCVRINAADADTVTGLLKSNSIEYDRIETIS